MEDLRVKRSNKADAIVKKWEGYHRALSDGSCEAYADPGWGWQVPTIGFGTTRYAAAGFQKFGRNMVREGDVLTREEAESELAYELDQVEAALSGAILVPITQAMMDAMCSFAFNLGLGSTQQQINRINARRFEECAASFDLYVNANGRPLPGLVNRRNEEEALFRSQGLSPGNAGSVPEQPTSIGRPYAAASLPLSISRTLRAGDQGLDVYVLQCALIGLGYLRAPKKDEYIGDVFNGAVDYAVSKYQQDVMGETPDGVFGPNTKAAIEASLREARGQKSAPRPAGKPVRCVFTMDLEPSQALRAGTLSFLDAAGNVVRKESATSGLPGFQTAAHIWTRGAGPVPAVPNQAIRFSDGYNLDTRGIEGWAFPMTPDPIFRNGNIGRSEIMLHRDANVPGTAGCIGLLLSKADYDQFVAWAKPFGTLPLEVKYT
jgi:GH24 family phage-related lysozyme (muramidase)